MRWEESRRRRGPSREGERGKVRRGRERAVIDTLLAEESEAVGEEWRGKKRWRGRHLMTGGNFLLHSWREGEEAVKQLNVNLH